MKLKKYIVDFYNYIFFKLYDPIFNLFLFLFFNYYKLVKPRISLSGFVLHIGNPLHVIYHLSKNLKSCGVDVGFLAIGKSVVWDQADYHYVPPFHPVLRARSEAYLFWSVIANYDVLHLHNASQFSYQGWALRVFKEKMNRTVVIHWRGCDIREYEVNTRLHPDFNICQNCDYDRICETKQHKTVKKQAMRYGDTHIVTTPDMRDFMANAVYVPFALPDLTFFDALNGHTIHKVGRPGIERPLQIVHVTNHPGIEGTDIIESIINDIRNKGYQIDFIHLRGKTFKEILLAYKTADVSIGKMKMGHYANAQIESLMAHVPAITYVREEFVTEEMRESGLILTSLEKLSETIFDIIEKPEIIKNKKIISRKSIMNMHDIEKVTKSIIEIYDNVKKNN
ncbi:hypothetical protein MTBPR1_20078 [Candidatus Terasakiella magnetica]|uniref:Glycosyltransferase n=1 Tax=Candidatus Terasakiella magnetica TaxID=1867952 RepID=A0A1C3RG24_9PROT|nr:hypothetical protein [Candidatus Terasakiella magnetica]SCA56230.1 hypothetical protein MTBPR1_20078 [Candidatus Terasakiella magnetica]